MCVLSFHEAQIYYYDIGQVTWATMTHIHYVIIQRHKHQVSFGLQVTTCSLAHA